MTTSGKVEIPLCLFKMAVRNIYHTPHIHVKYQGALPDQENQLNQKNHSSDSSDDDESLNHINPLIRQIMGQTIFIKMSD